MKTDTPNHFTDAQVKALCLKALNLGMTLRQNQLNHCGGDKSGKDILDEIFPVYIRRRDSGLDPLT